MTLSSFPFESMLALPERPSPNPSSVSTSARFLPEVNAAVAAWAVWWSTL